MMITRRSHRTAAEAPLRVSNLRCKQSWLYSSACTCGACPLGLILTTFTIVGGSNAVNLTDGLDGLAIGCTLIVSVVFVVLTYVAGNARAAAYLLIPFVPGADELTVFC